MTFKRADKASKEVNKARETLVGQGLKGDVSRGEREGQRRKKEEGEGGEKL